MPLKTYNGFTHAQRMKGFRWLQRQYAAGARREPLFCDACGQTEGSIAAHSEDYSEPYGPHIGRFGLCYRCHMAIHTRDRNPIAWDTYRRHVREGRIYAPIGKNFPLFCRQTLRDFGEGVPYLVRPARETTLLDAIHLGVSNSWQP